VLSRCQRFDFQRIPTKTIATTLSTIAKEEKFKIAEDALYEIAKAGDGSLRDAESILDQMASFSKGEVSLKDVTGALGSMNPEELFELFGAIATHDAAGVLKFVDRVMRLGQDPGNFLEKCLDHLRNLTVVKVSPDLKSIIEASDSYCKKLGEQAAQFSKDDLFYIFSVFSGAGQNLKRFSQKRVPLEMAFLRCALREPMVGVLDAEAKLGAAIKKAAASAPSPAPVPSPESKKNSKSEPVAEAAAEMPIVALPEPVEALISSVADKIGSADNDLSGLWGDLVKRVRSEKMSAASFLQEGEALAIEGDTIVIGFGAEHAFNAEALTSDSNIQLLEKHASDILKKKTRVQFRLGAATQIPQDSKSNSVLKTALGIFGGRIVRS